MVLPYKQISWTDHVKANPGPSFTFKRFWFWIKCINISKVKRIQHSYSSVKPLTLLIHKPFIFEALLHVLCIRFFAKIQYICCWEMGIRDGDHQFCNAGDRLWPNNKSQIASKSVMTLTGWTMGPRNSTITCLHKIRQSCKCSLKWICEWPIGYSDIDNTQHE